MVSIQCLFVFLSDYSFLDVTLFYFIEPMSTVQQVFEEVLDDVLGSWTALELAMTHYDGHFRDAQYKRMTLLGSVSDAVRSDKYELEDVAEFLYSFMDEEFNMELDDNSHVDVASVILNAWYMVRQGVRPQLAKRATGAAVSVIQDKCEEVDGGEETDDVNMDDEDDKRNQSNHQPKIVTDEDGWSTVVPRNGT